MSAGYIVARDPAPVPQELWGLWRRERLDVGGWSDTDTAVFWLQTRKAFIDLRLPKPSLAVAWPSLLDACGPADRERLDTIEGFAGDLDIAGDLLSWKRAIDLRPGSGLIDEGRMEWIDPDTLLETGLHAPYSEIWRRDPSSVGPVASFTLVDDRAGCCGQLLLAGGRFSAVLTKASEPQTADATYGIAPIQIMHGRVSDWRIELSSWPWLMGQPRWTTTQRLDAGRLQTDDEIWMLTDASISGAALDAYLPG